METTADPGNRFTHQCSSCDNSSARCWCLDCNEALCDVCVSAHRRVTLTRSHRILNQPAAGCVSTPPTKFCRIHPSEPLKLFCFTCKQVTCRDCQLMTHMNHSYQFVSEALSNLKKQLDDLVQPIRAQRATARQSLLDMETRLQQVSESQSNLKEELQQSYFIITQHLKRRMEELLKEIKKVCELERETIQRKMTKLKQMQQNQQLVTETAEKAQNASDLLTLLAYTAEIESQMKNLPDRDSSPPQTMFQMNVVTERTSLEAILKFGELQVSWIPFSVPHKSSNQNIDTPASSTSTSSSHLNCTRPAPLPQTKTSSDTDSPVPVNCSSAVSNSSSTPLGPPPPYSSRSLSTSFTSSNSSQSSATPLTFLSTLSQTGNTCDTNSPVLVSLPSSRMSSSNQLSLPPSSCLSSNQSIVPVTSTTTVTSLTTAQGPSSSVRTFSHLGTNLKPVLLPLNNVPTSVKLQPVSLSFTSSAGASPSFAVVKLAKPSTVLNQLMAPHQSNTAFLMTNTQTAYQLSCWPSGFQSVVPQFPVLLNQTVSYALPGNACLQKQENCSSLKMCPAATTGNQIPVGLSQTTLPSHEQKADNQPLNSTNSTTVTSGALSSEISPNSAFLKLQQLCLPLPVTPPTSTCLAPTCRPLPHTAPPVPDEHLTASRTTTSDQLCPSYSSSVTPPTTTYLTPSCETLPQTENTCDTDSPVPVNSPPPSSCTGINQSSVPVTTTTEVTSGALTSSEGPTTSPLKHQQQSPVVKAVADSACDRSVQQVVARQHEHAENEPTSTMSEETEAAGKPFTPEVSDKDEPIAEIGHPDYSLSKWQPRVRLFRLPVSPPHPGRTLTGYRLVPGDAKDEIYLEKMSKDSQSHVDDIVDDLMEPLSPPESPVTLQIVSCSACGSANGSIICWSCGRGYHRDCHVPPVGPDIWSEWTCSLCQDLSDPSDPYSSDRPRRPQSPCLSLLDQRRCESLLLHLKVEGCQRLSELGVWPQLKEMSERLTLHRLPAYPSAAELLSDIWSLFNDASQDDDALNELQESFQSREMEIFSSELHPSALTPPSGEGEDPAVRRPLGPLRAEVEEEDLKGSEVTPKKQEVITSESELKKTRKRLRDFLDLMGTSGPKRTKTRSHV
ncbi:transcription intermediary factor 1-beta [Micropterus salmoides]|uniref:transcription intermediary factor 1-beta n=1 Tax=Micropterus salmoides TaxID=27706 RepID=UPI0018EDEF41|nr:transcription intermediary factor 1-beta [Micropterus salmoides]